MSKELDVNLGRELRPPPCYGLSEAFYGPETDGRREEGRKEREAFAVDVCMGCDHRMLCLERALVLEEHRGVWGGMTEGERRKFNRHLRAEGYTDGVPEGDELWSSLNAYYRAQERNVS